MTEEEWQEFVIARRSRNSQNLQDMLGSRRAPCGQMPYWGTGKTSETAGCCPGQEEELRTRICEKGLAGVEVLPGGDVKFASPSNQTAYLNAMGMGDFSSGGSGEMKGTGGSIKRKGNRR